MEARVYRISRGKLIFYSACGGLLLLLGAFVMAAPFLSPYSGAFDRGDAECLLLGAIMFGCAGTCTACLLTYRVTLTATSIESGSVLRFDRRRLERAGIGAWAPIPNGLGIYLYPRDDAAKTLSVGPVAVDDYFKRWVSEIPEAGSVFLRDRTRSQLRRWWRRVTKST